MKNMLVLVMAIAAFGIVGFSARDVCANASTKQTTIIENVSNSLKYLNLDKEDTSNDKHDELFFTIKFGNGEEPSNIDVEKAVMYGNNESSYSAECIKMLKYDFISCSADVGDFFDASGLKSEFSTLKVKMSFASKSDGGQYETEEVNLSKAEPFDFSKISLHVPTISSSIIQQYCADHPNAEGCDTSKVDDADGDGVKGDKDACPYDKEIYDSEGNPSDGVLDGCPTVGGNPIPDPVNPIPNLPVNQFDGGGCSLVSGGAGSPSSGWLFVMLMVSMIVFGTAKGLAVKRHHM